MWSYAPWHSTRICFLPRATACSSAATRRQSLRADGQVLRRRTGSNCAEELHQPSVNERVPAAAKARVKRCRPFYADGHDAPVDGLADVQVVGRDEVQLADTQICVSTSSISGNRNRRSCSFKTASRRAPTRRRGFHETQFQAEPSDGHGLGLDHADYGHRLSRLQQVEELPVQLVQLGRIWRIDSFHYR